MDPVHLIWLLACGALAGGAIIGAIAYRNLAPGNKQADDLRAELDASRLELETYKTSVNNHFDKTAELVNELTQDYVKVYRHLAEGAQSLGEGRDFVNVLEQHQGKVLISVDNDNKVEETIVSEVPVDAQQTGETSSESAGVADHEPELESITAADNDDDGVKQENLDATGPSAETGEKQEPVIHIDKRALNPDADKADAKPVKSNGSGASGVDQPAKPDAQKESATSA
jgi:uncharacterized membrane-anchored protein YhcB (DUF1043 family)